MKVWKKLSAVALALVMVMALCAPAFAAAPTFGDMDSATTTTNEDGVLGEFDSKGEVKYTYSEKYVLLYKEITVYNQDESKVKAPTITYNYAVTAGQASATNAKVSITDKFDIPVEVKAGVTENVAVTGAVKKTTANSVESWNYEIGHLAFTPTDVELDAGNAGAKNVFPIKIDFSTVNFGGAGVYRYIITETVDGATVSNATDSDFADAQTAAKNAAGIADGTISNVRYLDVYVKDADNAASKTGANKYEIYGFVCFQNLDTTSETVDGTTTTTTKIDGTEQKTEGNPNGTATDANNLLKVAKTEGFVADKSGENTDLTADSYYTFNVQVSKTVEHDQAMIDHEFPFFVNFMNSSVTADVQIMTKKSVVKDNAATPTVTLGVLTAGKLSNTEGTGDNATAVGITHPDLKIDSGSNIKYIGIPIGVTEATSVTVYEQNNVTGTTYTSEYNINQAKDPNDSNNLKMTNAGIISWLDSVNKSDVAKINGTGVSDTFDQISTYLTNLAAWNGTGTTPAYAGTQTVDFTNTLYNISPTGVALRYAPYLAMMGAGIVALPLSLRKKEEEF